MSDRPWPVLVAAIILIAAGALVLGALWSGTEQGQAFAAAATSAYESSWLPWACAVVAAGCGVAMLFGVRFARVLVLIWMGYGVIEGLFLLDEQHYSVPVIAAYAVVAVLLFLPRSNEWFRKDAAAA